MTEEEDYSRFRPHGHEPSHDFAPEVPPAPGASEIPSDTIPYFREKARREASQKESQANGQTNPPASPAGSPQQSRSETPENAGLRKKLLNTRIWLAIGMPVLAVICLVAGLLIGNRTSLSRILMTAEDRQRQEINEAIINKLGPAIYTVKTEYVDDLPLDTLLDKALSGMMNSLDPHSMYIPGSDLDKVNEELEGEFSGVGVSFIIYQDSIAVVEVIEGGPASKVGILKGDRIVAAGNKPLHGKEITSDTVYKTLRGKKGSDVVLTVYRPSLGKKMNIAVKRGGVPVKSVDAAYMLDDGKTGYLKISSFTTSTYQEALTALNQLRNKGASEYVIDLRGNPGGFMDQAVLLANEFLPAGRRIVYTKARRKETEMDVRADGTGAFMNCPLAVIIDENSASASEILAGAVQDNDRGVIVGRRSFGKGLVQNQFDNAGGGALRLTVARYYTPSGRSIQKDYQLGDHTGYSEDLMTRYNNGELFSADSIRFDKSKMFKTVGGRNVYGGGGIMPDIFVPEDTTSYTPYFVDAMNSGLLMNFAFRIADTYRPLLKNVRSEEQLFRIIPDDSRLLSAFVEYGEQNGLPAAWYYINQSADMLVHKIKAFIARDILSDNLFYKMYNLDDTTLKRAREALDDKSLPREPQMR